MSQTKTELTKQQKIEHIVLNVPHMAKFCYKMYFGVCNIQTVVNEAIFSREVEDTPEGYIKALQNHAREYLAKGITDIDNLYDDIDGNNELVDPLP